VSNLFERLQRALAAEYEIEVDRGGGMSRKFLAKDLRHDRKVVLKVLPPEFAGDVNGGRFEREIRLAARLQHPRVDSLRTPNSVRQNALGAFEPPNHATLTFAAAHHSPSPGSSQGTVRQPSGYNRK
jgi:serine/threonine protein kinase